MNITEIVKHGVQFSIAFFQVEKLTEWLTQSGGKNCAYANFCNLFTFNYTAYEISLFWKNGMNKSSATVVIIVNAHNCALFLGIPPWF